MKPEKRFRAVFFDGDRTLCRNSESLARERDHYIGEIIGVDSFRITQEMKMKVFHRVWEIHPELKPVNTLEKEEVFWQRWYQLILEDHGVNFYAAALAKELYKKYRIHEIKELDLCHLTAGSLEHLVAFMEGG